MTGRYGWTFLVSGIITMVLAAACSKQDPYVPPDLFYYFASYKVGKNPTTITAIDINQDGVTDLMTTNVSSNTLSILVGNGDGSFHEQVQLPSVRSLGRSRQASSMLMPIWISCWPARAAIKLPYCSAGATASSPKGRNTPSIGHPYPLPATI